MANLDVTLIIPCFSGEKWIRIALKSICRQTLDRRRFEVLIIFNGTPDGSERIAREILTEAEGLNWRFFHSTTALASNARNIGINSAHGKWLALLDADDWISDNYLEALISSARPGVVPLGTVIDVDEESGVESASSIGDQIMSFPAGEHSVADIWRVLSFSACKLVPTSTARTVLFDAGLRSGEDIVFFTNVFIAGNYQVDPTPAHEKATYYRLVRNGSLSRQKPNYNFSVTQRLAVMKRLEDAHSSAPVELRPVLLSMLRSQAMFTKTYLQERPEDYSKIVEECLASNLRYMPWRFLVDKTSNLIISYNYPPFADPSAVVAAKRVLESGESWNVVSNDMSTVRRIDPDLESIYGPTVAVHKILKNPANFGSWNGVRSFCELGLEAIAEIELEQGPQTRLYSRSLWPASHFLAALHKERSAHEVRWIAEFSDPLRRNIKGRDRVGPVLDDELKEELVRLLEHRGFVAPHSSSLFSWSEILPYAVADEIIFTNPHQMTYMLSYLEDENLCERVRRVARIAPHPTLPRRYYTLASSKIQLQPGVINIGYFGSFYENRGLAGIIPALAVLTAKERERIRFHVFSSQKELVKKAALLAGVSKTVTTHDELPYLEFLNACTAFDVLLVVDVDTAADGLRVNPYLPSKLSDYKGSGSSVWALYEAGSTLSGYGSTFRSRIGRISETVRELRKMLEV